MLINKCKWAQVKIYFTTIFGRLVLIKSVDYMKRIMVII